MPAPERIQVRSHNEEERAGSVRESDTSLLSQLPIKYRLYAYGSFYHMDVPLFFSISYTAEVNILEPLQHLRGASSMSGVPSELIVVGGGSTVPDCGSEKYRVALNKWSLLPPTNILRCYSGTCFLLQNEPSLSVDT